jgi:hypothetical protein
VRPARRYAFRKERLYRLRRKNTLLMADRVSVLIVAGLHSFLGDVENRGVRVLDVLNDDHTAFLHLHDVAVFRGFQGECLKRMSDATIPKRTVDFVMIESTVHEAPLRRKHGYIEKRPQSALVLMAEYEIRGTFMLKGSADSLLTSRRETPTFFPITSAYVRRLESPGESIKANVLLVNNTRVSLAHLEPQPIAENESDNNTPQITLPQEILDG